MNIFTEDVGSVRKLESVPFVTCKIWEKNPFRTRCGNLNKLFGCLDYRYKWAATWDFQQCGLCDQHSLRSACAYAQSDQSLCYLLEYSMNIRLLTEHHLEFLSSQARLSIHLSKCHIVGNHMSWLIFTPFRLQSKTLILSTNVDKKSLET